MRIIEIVAMITTVINIILSHLNRNTHSMVGWSLALIFYLSIINDNKKLNSTQSKPKTK